jgi:DNA-binding NarL/FixJ family response regulator
MVELRGFNQELNMAVPSSKKHWTIFLVDDHVLLREWLTNLITQQPDLAVCGEAASAEEAMQKIIAAKPDMAIVDISLKESSGIELIKNIKERCPQVAILVLSMHEGSHHVERALQAGANGYVMKRESAKDLIAAIRRILDGRFYVSQDTAQALAARYVGSKSGSGRSPIEQLSDRELEVFGLLGEGNSVIQIAQKLKIDVKTVHTYCSRMREKLHVGSTVELLREAFRWQESRDSS